MAAATISVDNQPQPHFALLCSAGMGHLNPFTRLAATLSLRNCTVSFIAPKSTVSLTESLHISHLLTSYPSIQFHNLPIVELLPSEFPSTDDPFLRHTEAIRRAALSLPSVLSSLSSPVSVLIVDIFSASAFTRIANQLNIPCYILFTSSASMLSLVSHFPTYISTRPDNSITDINIPNIGTVPKSSVPSALHNPTNLFSIQFIENSSILSKSADGILLNTYQALEAEAITALNSGEVVPNLAPVFAIGPFRDDALLVEKIKSSVISWLDQQPQKSVVYVSFGSRIAMALDQIRELGIGLEKSGQRFLWVIKMKKVDREEETEKTRVDDIVGEGYEERVKNRGMVVKGWVEQREILNHWAVGGFVSHCGWNSVMEAAASGVRVLGWPRMGDQRLNGEVVRRNGLGWWMEEWKWESDEGVVSGEEIGRRVKEMMEDEKLEESAKRVREEALKAVGEGGSSEKVLDEFISRLRKF